MNNKYIVKSKSENNENKNMSMNDKSVRLTRLTYNGGGIRFDGAVSRITRMTCANAIANINTTVISIAPPTV